MLTDSEALTGCKRRNGPVRAVTVRRITRNVRTDTYGRFGERSVKFSRVMSVTGPHRQLDNERAVMARETPASVRRFVYVKSPPAPSVRTHMIGASSRTP
jgi:hypothetical protein